MNRFSVFLCAAVCAAAGHAQTASFSGDSAYQVLRILVNEIGPRPMGSPAERRALEFAVARFRQYGCQEAYVMPIAVAAGVNTSSGVAVGVLKGKTGRIIVIGGHIDSSGPDIPGANDDGSGAATVIELARVLGGRQHESTVLFCCWGGEEEGLRGSEHFVAHYAGIDSVVLMLQIDMADGSGELMADPDGEEQISAPRWLVDAAFEIFYGDLNGDGLVYPTQAATINASTPGGTGSDHMPFLRKGIPAIDFTSDVSYPIHTPLDNWANFNPTGLARSGELVLRLFQRFDAGVPSRETEKYWMFILGTTPVFFTHAFLRVLGLFAIVCAIVAGVVLRRRRLTGDPAGRVRWSTLKLLLVTVVVQSFLWFSGDIIGLVKGYRFPWVNNYPGFVVLGVLSGLFGLWLCLRLLRRFPLSRDPYVYYLRAGILLLLLTILLSLPNAELGIYPALSLFFVALALLVRPPWLKAVFILAAPYPMVRLVFIEYLGLFQRMLTQAPAASALASIAYNIGFILGFTILSLPFIYAFAAVYRSTSVDLFWVKKFRGTGGLVLAASGVIAAGTYLLFQPVFSDTWQPGVRVMQSYTLGADSGIVTASSGEFLTGVRFSYDGRDTTIDAKITSATLPTARPALVPWVSLADTTTQGVNAADSMKTFTRQLSIRAPFRPLAVNVSYRSSAPFTADSRWAAGGRRRMERESDRVKTFSWYAFPESVLVIPVTFTLRDTQKVRETIEVTFDSLAYPVMMHRDQTYFTQRSVVSASRTFSAPAESQ